MSSLPVDALNTAVVSSWGSKHLSFPVVCVNCADLVESNLTGAKIVQVNTARENLPTLGVVNWEWEVKPRPATLDDPHSPLRTLPRADKLSNVSKARSRDT